jgi:DNA-binding CsgD family transcriptional regulator
MSAISEPITRLPPGLIDDNFEFFMKGPILKALHKGQVSDFKDIPEKVKNQLMREMTQNEDVMLAFDKAGISQPTDQLYVYTKCMYGGFNYSPDITAEGIGQQDHHDCKADCQCVLKPILKEVLPVKNGKLTKREIEVVKMITHSFLGKQIAAEMGISPYTVDKHKARIMEKTGLKSNVQIALWANENNVL